MGYIGDIGAETARTASQLSLGKVTNVASEPKVLGFLAREAASD